MHFCHIPSTRSQNKGKAYLVALPVNVALAVAAHCVVAQEAGEAVDTVVGLAAAGVGASRDVADEALASGRI